MDCADTTGNSQPLRQAGRRGTRLGRLLLFMWLGLHVGCGHRAAAAASSGSEETAGVPPTWEALAGWRSETLNPPLSFAPGIPLKGAEELRFAPGFFQRASEGYFTYAFIWRFGVSPPTDAELEAYLSQYFQGLCSAVTNHDARCQAHAHVASLRETAAERPFIDTLDGFNDAAPVRLGVERIERGRCTGADGSFVLIALAPMGAPGSTWDSLRRQAAAFRC